MSRERLAEVAQSLTPPGKGILAADESTGTIKKRLDTIEVESTEENRQAYREVLLTTPGMRRHISGVILFDETIRQKTKDGIPFPDILSGKGVIPGIKVDQGTEEIPEFPGEKVTKGLSGLAERLKEYWDLGARFTKWRAVYSIGPQMPSQGIIERNAEALAQYALISQQAGFVPILEPEVLMDGAHSIQKCEEVTTRVLTVVFKKLQEKGVDLSGMLLKPNMVLPGKDSPNQVSDEEIAKKTIEVLKATVPHSVSGIVFLSGGQKPEEATRRLNAMNRMNGMSEDKVPWQLSFSYGRALQEPVLLAWMGKPENVKAAKRAFLKRAAFNSLARSGLYEPGMEEYLTRLY